MNCERCGLAKNPICLNGNVPNEDRTVARRCPNLTLSLRLEEAKKRVDPRAKDARVITSSPLYTPRRNHTSEPGVDLTGRNVHIQGITWNQFMPHLKLIQMCKNIKIRHVTDGDLRDIFVGNKNYKARPLRLRENEDTFNGIGGLLEANDDLLIIRVGFLGYKNAAGPGFLSETLLYRMAASKPCWIFESSHALVSWRYTKDADVENLVSKYMQVHLTSPDPATEDLSGMQYDGPAEDVGPSEFNSAVPDDDGEVSLPVPDTGTKITTVSNLEDDLSGGPDLFDFEDRKPKKKRRSF